MATLLLRLAAPLQAWGTDEAKFETRKTGREPTKSGVIGMIAAAMGYRRDEPEKLTELNELRMGVRIEREGKLLRDFHTAKKTTAKKSDPPYVTNRYYLCDAVFLVGLEGPDELMARIEYAITHPVFAMFLGRRSCPPTPPVLWGKRETGLIDALTHEPSLMENGHLNEISLYADDDPEYGKNAIGRAAVRDLPVSFDSRSRRHTYRTVTEYRTISINSGEYEEPTQIEHDPLAELEAHNVSIEN